MNRRRFEDRSQGRTCMTDAAEAQIARTTDLICIIGKGPGTVCIALAFYLFPPGSFSFLVVAAITSQGGCQRRLRQGNA